MYRLHFIEGIVTIPHGSCSVVFLSTIRTNDTSYVTSIKIVAMTMMIRKKRKK